MLPGLRRHAELAVIEQMPGVESAGRGELSRPDRRPGRSPPDETRMAGGFFGGRPEHAERVRTPARVEGGCTDRPGLTRS